MITFNILTGDKWGKNKELSWAHFGQMSQPKCEWSAYVCERLHTCRSESWCYNGYLPCFRPLPNALCVLAKWPSMFLITYKAFPPLDLKVPHCWCRRAYKLSVVQASCPEMTISIGFSSSYLHLYLYIITWPLHSVWKCRIPLTFLPGLCNVQQ